MLIPIGFFGAGGGAASYEFISTAVGTGSSGTITLSSIPNTYKHLQVRYLAKSTVSGVSAQINMTLNSDSSTVYNVHQMTGNGSSPGGSGLANRSNISLQNLSDSTIASSIGAGIIDILDYANTSKFTTVKAINGKDSSIIYMMSGSYRNTSAISTITFVANGAQNFSTLSRFSLYGIKGD